MKRAEIWPKIFFRWLALKGQATKGSTNKGSVYYSKMPIINYLYVVTFQGQPVRGRIANSWFVSSAFIKLFQVLLQHTCQKIKINSTYSNLADFVSSKGSNGRLTASIKGNENLYVLSFDT